MTSLDIASGMRTALTRLREAWEWYDAIPPVRKIHSALGQFADGWRRVSRWLNSVMPKGLYARALLIIIAPMTSPLGRLEREETHATERAGQRADPRWVRTASLTQGLRDALTARTNHQAIRL